MTTFHDPPPQSRRAARQSERERAPDEQPTVEGFTTFPSQEAAENRVDESRANPDDAETPTATPPASAAQTTPPPPTAAPGVPPAPAASRPSTDAAYRAAPPPSPHSQYSTFAPPPPPATVAQSAPPAAAEPGERPSPPPAAVSAASETNAPERTLTRRELRELRSRQEAELADAAPASTPPPAQAVTLEQMVPAYVEPPALVDPLSVAPQAASASEPPENALSVFESLLANADGSANNEATTDAPPSPLVDRLRDAGPAKSVSELNFGDTGTPVAPEQTPADLGADQQPKSVAEPKPSARPTLAGLLGLAPDISDVEPAPTVEAPATNLSNARAEFDEQARKRLDGELPAISEPQIGVPDAETASAAPLAAPNPAPTIDASGVNLAPTGHWSRQAAEEDEPSDSVITRTIGSGTSTTSALVLPAIPFATDIRGPVNSSGEAMFTGSIDLPSTLSASGVSDRFDNADIDSLLDLNDSDMVSTDSAPVRAVTAVSTFSNQSVTQTQKPKGTRALTVLLISASSMAVVVAGLLVAAFAFNML